MMLELKENKTERSYAEEEDELKDDNPSTIISEWRG